MLFFLGYLDWKCLFYLTVSKCEIYENSYYIYYLKCHLSLLQKNFDKNIS